MRQRAAILSVDWRRKRSLHKARWFVVAAAAAATVLAVLVVFMQRGRAGGGSPAQSALVVAGDAALHEGQWLHASDAAPIRLRFADGTELELQAESTGRLASRSSSEARLTLEKGRLHARVTSAALSGRSWTFEAGVYEVVVVGTALDVSWSPDSGRLRIGVEHGRVRVRGGQLERDGLLLGAGDRLDAEPGRVELRRARIAADASASAPAAKPPATPQPPAVRPPSAAEAPAMGAKLGAPPASAAAVAESDTKIGDWKSLARAGRYEEALGAAHREGFDALLAQLAAADLALLADAARLSGDNARARSALLTLRRRFAGSDAASLAAFRLGRLAFGAGDYPDAARWFRTYLAESRSGALADEATGRLVEAQARAGDRAGAEASARDYLRRFPGGPYEALARGLLKGDRLAPRK
jgi:TolA-binding protein